MSMTTKMPTKFAPAERIGLDEVRVQGQYFDNNSMMNPMLDAVPNMVVVLNKYRQIVYANQRFQATFAENDLDKVLGKRPGEAVACVHSNEESGGCGTAEACSTCGAAKAILSAQKGTQSVEECRIALAEEEDAAALDLRVWATPIEVEGDLYTIFAIDDISDEKRRLVLERIFFHDIINTAGAIQGLVQLLDTMTDPMEFQDFEFGKMLSQASEQLLDEIVAQRQLVAAERGELMLDPRPIKTRLLMEKVANLYRNHQVGFNKQVVIDPVSENIELVSDKAVLGRVLGNLVKNALEASKAGETVTIGCERLYDYVRFWVHNKSVMPRHVQLQVFKRSFSTKGKGRGLGTYSIKLLTEKYLQGRVSFESDHTDGTAFSAMVPLVWLAPADPEVAE